MGTKEMCIIFNPAAGRGRAARWLDELRAVLGSQAEFWPTDGPGHGEELALRAAKAGFTTVAAAGGDGTVHEVANGLLRAARPEVVLAVYPVGSANDYADTLGLKSNWWRNSDGVEVHAVDVGRVSAPGGRQRFFVNGLGLGFNGAVTLESRRIRWLRGLPLYACALLRALWGRFDCPPLTVTMDGVTGQAPTLALTVNLGRREGNFPLTPGALLDDGLFDYVHAGALRRWELLRYLPRMISGRLPTNHPLLRLGRCKAIQLQSPTPLIVHTDGEFFCQPSDDVRTLAIELLPGALRVQGRW